MTQPNPPQPKRSPLDAQHRALGARMELSEGWDLPVEYAGAVDEHLRVRSAAGLFDVCHRGQIEIAGRDALKAVQWVMCNDADQLGIGQVQASALLTPAGTVVDSLRVCRLATQHFLLVVNGATVTTDLAWIREQTRLCGDVLALDTSSRYAMLALQGPLARQVLQTVLNCDLSELQSDWFTHGEVARVRATISRTGDTGEDGYEILVPPAQAATVWRAVLEAGEDDPVVPAGMGAFDTLRLEAGVRLYGRDVDISTTALDAGLDGIVAWQKPAFLGREALVQQKVTGPARRLVGFEMMDGAVARHGAPILVRGERTGVVTSGAHAPSLGRAIGLAYVRTAWAADGAEVDVDIAGRFSRARIVPLPFYTRPKG
jgi:aminomethyltransferase